MSDWTLRLGWAEMGIEWREIAPGYIISSDGQIGSRRRGGLKMLRLAPFGKGYCRVTIYDGKSSVSYQVHRLVAEAFIGPAPSPSHEINHKNGIKHDNRAANLEWVTKSENMRHRFDVLKHGAPRGKAQTNAKLTEAKVRDLRRRRARGETLRTIAADLGIDLAHVSNIAHGKTWNWLDAEHGPVRVKSPAARGERIGNARLTEANVRDIRARRLAGEKLGAIAADLGVAIMTVCAAATGRSWGWLK